MIIGNPRILTISFETGDSVILQYHPDELVINHNSMTNSVSGVNDLITFIAGPNTTNLSIRLSTYLTSVKPRGEPPTQIATGAGLGVSLALAGTQVASGNTAVKTLLDSFSVATQSIALTKGLFDITSGVITQRPINLFPSETIEENINKLKTLSGAIDRGLIADIKLDLLDRVYRTPNFVINNMDVNIQSINDENSESMIMRVVLNIIKAGNTVRVV